MPADWLEQLADCAREFAKGDFSALGQLFDLTASRLLRYAHSITRNRDDAEDAVQAAIIRLARNPQSLAAVRWPWAYLLKMTRNEAMRIAARKRSRSWFSLVQVSQVRREMPPPPSAIPESERDAEIQLAIQRLPDDQAEVVVLKIWEGLTFQEIADVTGESLNTIASRYRYALSKLQYSLKRTAHEVGYVVD